MQISPLQNSSFPLLLLVVFSSYVPILLLVNSFSFLNVVVLLFVVFVLGH